MPLIKEIEDALKLVAELPKIQQEVAAFMLRTVVMNYEEETTMTDRERRVLAKQRKKENEKRHAAFLKRMRKYL